MASARRGLQRADLQKLVFLNTYWGNEYVFAAPETPGGPWTATARFGQQDRLEAQDSSELLEKVRAHYQVNRPKGGR